MVRQYKPAAILGWRGLRVTVIKLTFHHPGRPGDCQINSNNNNNNNNNTFRHSNFKSTYHFPLAGWNRLDQNPSLLRGEALDPNTIQLQWRISSSNCEVIGYRIYVEISPDGEAYSIDVDEGETNEYLIKNLIPNTRYDFDIAAILPSEILPPVGVTVRVDTPSSKFANLRNL